MADNIDEFADELQEKIIEEMKREYTETAVEHWIHPRNLGKIEDADAYGRITGPCGDTMEIYLKIKKGKITGAHFITDGCGGTIVCGSVITELATGKYPGEAEEITQEVILGHLGGLPEANRHCALLAANTLQEALKNYKKLKKTTKAD
ncbi:MAG: iron-sulfur cluster assembly scaffold protein [Candidatus Aerophobetes bacterium]|nr:iron-sulfur cluster assembly scaffold protein [Candidatus Aerophobetes bacterium]